MDCMLGTLTGYGQRTDPTFKGTAALQPLPALQQHHIRFRLKASSSKLLLRVGIGQSLPRSSPSPLCLPPCFGPLAHLTPAPASPPPALLSLRFPLAGAAL